MIRFHKYLRIGNMVVNTRALLACTVDGKTLTLFYWLDSNHMKLDITFSSEADALASLDILERELVRRSWWT